MNNQTNTGRPAAELQELADAYVCGALNSDETDAFEGRLAEDQAAREAVAKAVSLTAVAHAAISQPTVTDEPTTTLASARTAKWSESFEWAVTIATVGLLAVALVVGASRGPRDSSLVSELNPPTANDELAVIWGEMLTSYPLGNSTDSADASGEGNVDDFLMTLDEGELPIADSPEWMLAAVTEISAQDDMNHERDMENRQ